jgi:hypothetical protein
MTSRTSSYWYVQERITEQRYDREKMLRDLRVLEFVSKYLGICTLQDVMLGMGLSYRQAVESLARLEYFGDIVHVQTRRWNGRHYIYPHQFWAR